MANRKPEKPLSRDELSELAEKVSGKEQIEELILKVSQQLADSKSDLELLRMRAGLYVKLQEYGKAINDYNQVLSHDSSDKEARAQAEMLKTILRYNNTDIYSSTNTDMDPWME